ncbi:hypothetical protein SAMN04487906_3060 [Zhouia amylolytica]|uniref:Uncharacterized protein n=2 Tax=Zhouia amylolytica TaxID=376730 RepID=W2ULW6_9FLAO|nr:hypothetical protein P278_23840 [Zhouia amylolytica AD3]SFT12135.1 hypothetical protein SAMN04487906_3060 [Zhouia amylolytica]
MKSNTQKLKLNTDDSVLAILIIALTIITFLLNLLLIISL